MNKIIYACAAALAICAAMNMYSESAARDLEEGVTRLHIIANSDGAADRAVKLKVRDAVLETARENNGADTAELCAAATRTLRDNGFAYGVREYNGLRIVLGNGAGKNWWCVMNPPLCFTEDTDGAMSDGGMAQLKSALSGETYELVTKKPEIRFKIVELLGELKRKTGK